MTTAEIRDVGHCTWLYQSFSLGHANPPFSHRCGCRVLRFTFSIYDPDRRAANVAAACCRITNCSQPNILFKAEVKSWSWFMGLRLSCMTFELTDFIRLFPSHVLFLQHIKRKRPRSSRVEVKDSRYLFNHCLVPSTYDSKSIYWIRVVYWTRLSFRLWFHKQEGQNKDDVYHLPQHYRCSGMCQWISSFYAITSVFGEIIKETPCTWESSI